MTATASATPTDYTAVLMQAERLLRRSPTGRVPDADDAWSSPQGGASWPGGWLEYGSQGITITDQDRTTRTRWPWSGLRRDLAEVREREPEAAARRDHAEAIRLARHWQQLLADARMRGPRGHFLGVRGDQQDLAMYERYAAMAADEAAAAAHRIGTVETQLALFAAA